MKRWIVLVAFLMAFPIPALAYTLQQLPKTKDCASPALHTQWLRPSRRQLWQRKLSWLSTHRVQPLGLLSYNNAAEGVQLRYPAAWTAQEQLLGTLVSFLSPLDEPGDRIRENVTVLLRNLPDGSLSLQDFTAGTLSSLQHEHPDLTFLASEGTILGSTIAAHGVTYEQDTAIGRMKFRQVWAIAGPRAILLTFTATPQTFDRYHGAFETMLRTVSMEGSR